MITKVCHFKIQQIYSKQLFSNNGDYCFGTMLPNTALSSTALTNKSYNGFSVQKQFEPLRRLYVKGVNKYVNEVKKEIFGETTDFYITC